MAAMTWIFVAAGPAAAGLAVVAVLAVRAFTAARALGAELDRARLRLGMTDDEFQMAITAKRAGYG
jgi:hypothetical protein